MFIILTGFIVLDYGADYRVSIILGRLFLNTRITLKDVIEGTLKIRLDDVEVVFKVYITLHLPSYYKYL